MLLVYVNFLSYLYCLKFGKFGCRSKWKNRFWWKDSFSEEEEKVISGGVTLQVTITIKWCFQSGPAAVLEVQVFVMFSIHCEMVAWHLACQKVAWHFYWWEGLQKETESLAMNLLKYKQVGVFNVTNFQSYRSQGEVNGVVLQENIHINHHLAVPGIKWTVSWLAKTVSLPSCVPIRNSPQMLILYAVIIKIIIYKRLFKITEQNLCTNPSPHK